MNAYRQQQLRAPDLYHYHGIAYTYGELQKAYRKQQLTIQVAIDSGNYNAACEAANLDAREFLPQIARRKPEQIETGDKRTLTPNRKCSIIKAIKRHVRRMNRKTEGKTMENLTTALLNAAKNTLKTRINGDKIDQYEMRFSYRGETFRIIETETPNH